MKIRDSTYENDIGAVAAETPGEHSTPITMMDAETS